MTTSSAPRIAVVGSNMVDLVTYVNRMPVKGETIEAPRFEMGHGGKGANQAVAAAKLGASVMMVTAVGDDMFGEGTIRNLERVGVDTTYVRRVQGLASGVAPIMVEPNGENSILIVKGANADLSAADVERASEALKQCDLILLQLEVPLETVYAAIAFGKRHGVRTVLNPAPAAPNLDLTHVRDVSYLVPNETELGLLTGMPTETEANIEAAARGLLREGMRAVIVTLGGRGALLATADGIKRIAPTRVDPVDTTGAGDAFVGSFARYHARGLDLEPALAKAARYAADSVRRHGTQKAYATEVEFEAFELSLDGQRDVRPD
jgi:ribokinase